MRALVSPAGATSESARALTSMPLISLQVWDFYEEQKEQKEKQEAAAPAESKKRK